MLKPGGRVVLDVVDRRVDAPEVRAALLGVDRRKPLRLPRARPRPGRAAPRLREIVTHAERGVIADQFYAERLYTYPQLVELLERAGFKDVRQGADRPRTPAASRTSACSPAGSASWPPNPSMSDAAAPRAALSQCHRAARRSSQPDAVKREGVFSTEDIETIERMRAALGS